MVQRVSSPEIPIIPILRDYDGEVVDTDVSWRSMKCPFHTDTRPSARYNELGFICNGCGVKGDAIAVLRQVEGLDYATALRRAEEIIARSGEILPAKPARKPRRKPFEGSRS